MRGLLLVIAGFAVAATIPARAASQTRSADDRPVAGGRDLPEKTFFYKAWTLPDIEQIARP